MSEEIAAVIEGITDEIKQYMQVQGVDVLTGDEHKATYKAVESSRVDTSALKKERSRDRRRLYGHNVKPSVYILIIWEVVLYERRIKHNVYNTMYIGFSVRCVSGFVKRFMRC